MNPFDAGVAIVSIIAVFGTGWYIISGVFKLIRYRIERKTSGGIEGNKELMDFMERTEKRLRALEHIVTDDESDDLGLYINEADEKLKVDDSKSRLKNQLKS